MRINFGLRYGLPLLSGALLLTALPTPAAPSRTEKSLLGIRVLQNYKAVLAKFGQPTRVYRNGEAVRLVESVDAKGEATGGIRGLADDSSTLAAAPGGRGGRPGMMGGGMPGMAAPPGMMGMMGMPPGMMGSGGAPGASGSSMMNMMMNSSRGAGMGRPGMGGGAGMPGMMGGRGGDDDDRGGAPRMAGGGLPGATNAPGGGGEETFGQSGGFIWVYFYPKQERVYEFHFNRDGRVELIMEHGRLWGQPTSRGITLGSSLKQLYQAYGWPDSVEDEGGSFALNYNQKAHAYFAVKKNKVVRIAVFLRENQRVPSYGGQGGGQGGLGRGPSMAGMGGPGRAMPGLGGPGRAMPGLGGPGRAMPGLGGMGRGKGGDE